VRLVDRVRVTQHWYGVGELALGHANEHVEVALRQGARHRGCADVLNLGIGEKL
jgi:hypothetical protein